MRASIDGGAKLHVVWLRMARKAYTFIAIITLRIMIYQLYFSILYISSRLIHPNRALNYHLLSIVSFKSIGNSISASRSWGGGGTPVTQVVSTANCSLRRLTAASTPPMN
jgi:glycopeptide antibiotics resistance protein